jgi:hypothetical protein
VTLELGQRNKRGTELNWYSLTSRGHDTKAGLRCNKNLFSSYTDGGVRKNTYTNCRGEKLLARQTGVG